MDPTIGEVKLFAGNFAPISYMLCQGQLLPIQDYTPLFALIGTMYGGDGVQTFALPDLRGRIPVGVGLGPGLYNVYQGEAWGSENITLTVNTMPSHSHTSQVTATVNAGTGSGTDAAGAYWGTSTPAAYNATADATTLNPAALQVTAICNSTGSNAPFSNMQPYLAMNYIIAVEGIFPSRN